MPIEGTITLNHIGPRREPTQPAPPQKGSSMLVGKATKAAIPLDPSAVAAVDLPNGQPRVVLRISVGGRTVTADLAAKGVRKAIATIAEAGPDNVAVVVQGKLEADRLIEAGIIAQVKTPKPDAAAA